jgi:hypothetical protein
MPQQNTASQRALIPSTTIEFPIQRRWAASIFVLIQALKCVDLFALYTAEYPELYDGIVSKWLLIDALYFFALYFARIPWLQFSFFKTCLLIVLLTLLNLFLFAYPTVSLIFFFFVDSVQMLSLLTKHTHTFRSLLVYFSVILWVKELLLLAVVVVLVD